MTTLAALLYLLGAILCYEIVQYLEMEKESAFARYVCVVLWPVVVFIGVVETLWETLTRTRQ